MSAQWPPHWAAQLSSTLSSQEALLDSTAQTSGLINSHTLVKCLQCARLHFHCLLFIRCVLSAGARGRASELGPRQLAAGEAHIAGAEAWACELQITGQAPCCGWWRSPPPAVRDASASPSRNVQGGLTRSSEASKFSIEHP